MWIAVLVSFLAVVLTVWFIIYVHSKCMGSDEPVVETLKNETLNLLGITTGQGKCNVEKLRCNWQ